MTDHTDTPLERLAALDNAYDLAEVYVTAKTDPAAQMDLLCKDLRSLLSELTTLREEKERLGEALKPFAEFGPWMAGSLNVQEAIHLGTRRDEFAKRLLVADFRRAASALEEGK